MKIPSDRLVMLAKIGALALMFAFAPLAWVPEMRWPLTFLLTLTRYGKVPALYCAVVLLAMAGLVVTPFLRNHLLRVVLVAIFMSAYALDLVVLALSGAHADTSVIRTLWQGRVWAGMAFDAYRYVVVEHLIAVGALAVVFAWPYRRGFRAAFSLLPIGSLVMVTVHLSAWQGVIEGYPSPVAIPARLFLVLNDQTTTTDLPLKPVPEGHLRPSMFRRIVFILDESVRGDYLSINNRSIDTTPFLEQSADRLINFGIATSGANCSFQARWMLRRGVRPWQLPEERVPSNRVPDGIVHGPRTTMWQFAKAAGFKIVYVDPWHSVSGPFRDATTAEELTFVDQRFNLETEAQRGRDLAAARTLAGILKSSDRVFVQVDKLGAHLPYDEFTPDTFNRYTRSDGGRLLYNRKDEMVGAYKNAIAWSVDEFFRELLPNVDLRDTLIVYTSDHGENLGDGGYAWGHCTSGRTVHPSEEWIPLFALTGVPSFGQALSASASRSFSEATHFEIFPTLLIAMGYDPEWVTSVYGPSLLAIPAARPRQFLVGDVMLSRFRAWLPVAPWIPPDPGSGERH